MKNKKAQYKWKNIALTTLILTTLFDSRQTNAQTISIDSLTHTMQKVYQNYDSITFLSFDIRFNYSSDTLLGNYTNEQLDGNYTLAGRRAKYTLGNVDFMQNDSFLIAVYNSDQIILVDEPKTNNTGSQMPLRQMVDSLVKQSAGHYTITQSNVADTSLIAFIRADSLAHFDRFSISFNRRNYFLYKMDYQFTQPDQETDSIPTADHANRKQRLTIRFSNYGLANYDAAVYNQSNYIFFERGICRPVSKYKNFKVYNSKPMTIQ
ncbi:MAG: hypothetical protein ABI402_14210 [Ferruginibacter sp.]